MLNLLYIMRHGESVVNREHRLTCKRFDGALTPLGREQAARAGAWLHEKSITRILSSPFERAIESAAIIADRLGLSSSVDDGLREMDCGRLEGRTDEEAWGEWQQVYDRWKMCDWKAAFPDGETYRQAYDRLNGVLQKVQIGGTALLVTHGGITRTVIPYLCVNAAALQEVHPPDNAGFIILEPFGDGRFICRAWNQNEHLKGLNEHA
ncbi:MAG: histidine phosphatase family protein [Anaerolineae bacterium]|nr:histidine phosphatase family protein [Anaerolineae bacterium]